MTTKKTGAAGESAVAQWLTDHGFFVLEKNYRTREGEVDLIAQKDDLIVFVEVKTRKKRHFCLSQVIVPKKQKRLILAAKQYIFNQQYIDKAFRFDVALVEEGKDYTIEYIPNAFYSGE